MDDDVFALAKLLATNLDRYFPELVHTYQHTLYTFALRLSERSQDAEDIVQEALLRSYIALSHYPAEHIRDLQLRPWLYKLTLNVFRNSRRGLHRATFSLESTEESVVLEVPDSESVQPEIWYDLLERQQELANALYLLADHHREIIVCVYFEQLSYQEAATLLDIAPGTVRSRLNRGIKALRIILSTEREKNYETARNITSSNFPGA
ncbi:RNA polymerase sigma factor [Dictyobacter formicarum]|uniref:RNA polymerase sigma factor n=1 Tax=Dictyobacter formicarum TaxID=2778368 RepID=A0ABQ3V9A4_9CHLR|nr:RNA polymerase sigma factor [Dictyobacter formicarum]GHO82700.1 RNA polymerase sigma factor [Dictyobacter formicarum]